MLFPNKACKKHWKQQLSVKTVVYCIERHRNIQDMLVWKSNLVLWNKTSKDCGWLPWQPFSGKPSKFIFYSPRVQLLTIELSPPSVNKIFGVFWGTYHLNTGWPPNTGCKKNISNKVSTEKTFELKFVAFIFSILMICENKQGNQSLHLTCYITWNCMNK